MRLIYKSPLFRLPGFRRYDAVCIGRLILFKQSPDSVSQRLFNHEVVHQEQMDFYGVTGFYALYFWYYLRGVIRYRSHDLAYINNPFEVDARTKAETRS